MSFPQPSDFRPPIIPDGEVYDNPENGRSYYWTQILLPEGSTPDTATSIGGYWTVVCDSADGKYVLKAGDTMTGALEFDDTEEAIKFKPEAGQRQTVEVLRDDNAGTVGGGLDVFLLGNSDYNQLRILGRSSADGDKEFFKVGGNEGTSTFSGRVNLNKPVEDSEDSEGFVIKGTIANGPEDPTSGGPGKLLNVYHNANAADAINYAGKINSSSNLVNKGYVDDKDNLLRQDIIELEEEINAIAPSLEYGNWEWKQPANNTRPPEQGTFYLLDDALELTTSYDDASSIVISNYEYDDPNDNDPVDIHTWADADPDELIQLFDAADPDFLLGKIVQVHHDSPEHVRIEITRIQSSGVPNDNADPVSGLFLTRVNVFKEPSGGTASDFVLKSGDTMTGTLKIDVSEGGPTSNPGAAGKEASLKLKGDRTGTSDAAVTITFDNAASSYPGYLTYRSSTGNNQFFKFNQNVEFNNKDLSGITNIDVKTDLLRSGSKRITFQTYGSGEGKGSVLIHRATDLNKGFTIRGKIKNSTSEDLFYAYSNSGSTGDSIDYHGICTSGPHIMSRDHGDSRFVQTGTKGIKITKSSGNYYIQG